MKGSVDCDFSLRGTAVMGKVLILFLQPDLDQLQILNVTVISNPDKCWVEPLVGFFPILAAVKDSEINR